MKMRRRTIGSITLLVVLVSALFFSVPAAQQDFNFAIEPAFLRKLAADNSVLTKIEVRMDGRSGLHGLGSDCEMHIGGVPITKLGAPRAIVVEPPNLCKFAPNGKPGERGLETKWSTLFDSQVINKKCEVSGFFRIFTEHAQGGQGASNPDHVFEIHPAVSIDCGEEISFANMLRVFPGMSAIQPNSADSCFAKRKLEVRFKRERYEFRHNNAGTCGNFAVIKVVRVERGDVSDLDGGHMATATVIAKGTIEHSLTIYTITGSDADEWLKTVKSRGMGRTTMQLHGLITFDYRAIIKTIRAENGRWLKPTDWQDVPSPIALVVFGKV